MSLVEILDKFKLPLLVLLVGIVLIIGGFFSSNLLNKPKVAATQGFPKESLVSAKQISVDISGAVNKPGVYKLPFDSRVEEAVSASGGLSAEANLEYISKYLNMAQKLSDGSKVYLPKQGEMGVAVGGGSVAGVSIQAGSQSQPGGQVNINSASQSELEALPGIGPVTAAKIIASRPYQTIDDLQTQKIVSKSVFEKIKGSIVVH